MHFFKSAKIVMVSLHFLVRNQLQNLFQKGLLFRVQPPPHPQYGTCPPAPSWLFGCCRGTAWPAASEEEIMTASASPEQILDARAVSSRGPAASTLKCDGCCQRGKLTASVMPSSSLSWTRTPRAAMQTAMQL